MKRILAILTTVSFLAGCSGAGGPAEYARTEPLMSTFVQLKASSSERSAGELKSAVDGVFDLARELEERFSVYAAGSEINRLNLSKRMEVSPELFALLKEAKRISRLTGGEFDVTVAPVLKDKGFYADMPSAVRESIPDGLSGIGWENIELEDETSLATLRNNAWVDLSGIAKGYIVDSMVSFLREKGVDFFMINAGGDIFCARKTDGAPWRVGLREPGRNSIIITLDLKDMAVATSGDYENVIMDKRTGRAVSHIIDPSDDEAKPEVPSSVTVIAPTCVEADALATGMMAMGEARALKAADGMEGVEIITAAGTGRGKGLHFSRGAEKFISGAR